MKFLKIDFGGNGADVRFCYLEKAPAVESPNDRAIKKTTEELGDLGHEIELFNQPQVLRNAPAYRTRAINSALEEGYNIEAQRGVYFYTPDGERKELPGVSGKDPNLNMSELFLSQVYQHQNTADANLDPMELTHKYDILVEAPNLIHEGRVIGHTEAGLGFNVAQIRNVVFAYLALPEEDRKAVSLERKSKVRSLR